MRRRLFNLFAFIILAFAIYLVAFSKEQPGQPIDQTARAEKSLQAVTDNISH